MKRVSNRDMKGIQEERQKEIKVRVFMLQTKILPAEFSNEMTAIKIKKNNEQLHAQSLRHRHAFCLLVTCLWWFGKSSVSYIGQILATRLLNPERGWWRRVGEKQLYTTQIAGKVSSGEYHPPSAQRQKMAVYTIDGWWTILMAQYYYCNCNDNFSRSVSFRRIRKVAKSDYQYRHINLLILILI